MCLELSWELHEFAVIEEHKITLLELFLLDVSVMPRFFSSFLHLLLEAYDKSILLKL